AFARLHLRHPTTQLAAVGATGQVLRFAPCVVIALEHDDQRLVPATSDHEILGVVLDGVERVCEGGAQVGRGYDLHDPPRRLYVISYDDLVASTTREPAHDPRESNSARPKPAGPTRTLSHGRPAPRPAPCSCRDSIIAATALVHGMPVATRNVADFAPTGVEIIKSVAGCRRLH